MSSVYLSKEWEKIISVPTTLYAFWVIFTVLCSICLYGCHYFQQMWLNFTGNCISHMSPPHQPSGSFKALFKAQTMLKQASTKLNTQNLKKTHYMAHLTSD